jgi:hypothetical protein
MFFQSVMFSPHCNELQPRRNKSVKKALIEEVREEESGLN